MELSEKISGMPQGVKIIVTPETNASAAPTDSVVTLVVPTEPRCRLRAKRLTGSKNSWRR